MRHIILLLLYIGFQAANAQELASAAIQATTMNKHQAARTKPASYTALGYTIPLQEKDIIIGGTTTVYKKFGTFFSYKVGIENLMMPTKGERGDLTYDNIKKNNWTITGNTEQSATFMLSGGFAVALTRKIPLYFGVGATRFREVFEYIDPNDNKVKWNVNDQRTRIELNYTAGIFVPLFGRVIMNVGYDHNPQSVFVGLGIRGLYAFEDADEWWWGGNK